MQKYPESTVSSISLPKGGGAIKGIGETFQPNLFSGTGNFSVPIFTSPGRNGFGPELSLQYSSGNGNGVFGVGWQLSIPRVTRKTEKGLPTYQDDNDVFVMSGSEDLVPYSDSQSREVSGYTITRYRPRIEGQFAIIEKWEKDHDFHWRVTTKENVTSIYGRSPEARVTDPDDVGNVRVYEWLLEETFDVKGNHILYEYIKDNNQKSSQRPFTQTYIRRILYGNTPDGLPDTQKVGPIRMSTDHRSPSNSLSRHYLFEVLFDYQPIDENPAISAFSGHEQEVQIPDHWEKKKREDCFSSFRSGFEIRTQYRCSRVLMRHHFNEGELADASLVKSTNFHYEVHPRTQLSFLKSATVFGYRKNPAPDNPDSYQMADLPPVSFQYSEFQPNKQRFSSVKARGDAMPSQALNADNLTTMDVFGNGLPDILQSTAGGLYFWENMGEGILDMPKPQSANQPTHSFTDNNVSIGDMGGDGLADLIINEPPVSGFYESKPDGSWKPFKRFEKLPGFDLNDPNTRLVDLTGDGLSDVLVTADNYFIWYQCLGEAGYAEQQRVLRIHDLEQFPDVYFADPSGRVRLADMTGDGLSDIVLMHDGRVDYWPNLGYGRFGSRITIKRTPRIGFGYDPKRLFLADIDGSGCADLVYVEPNEVHYWFNQSGNSFNKPDTENEQVIRGTPNINDLTSIQFIDFYGTGTTTLLWSYDAGQYAGDSNYKLLDFCGGVKPNLLIEMDNNMGATTCVQYAPSTKFYLEDKANGRPWHTSLPFPVQVLEKTEVIDHISKTKLVTCYKYHHGYYDGREREFRGFGRVDQFDTEFVKDFTNAGLHEKDVEFDNQQKGFHLPPVETRTWFHTGIYFDEGTSPDSRDVMGIYRKEEFYKSDSQAFELPEPQLDAEAKKEAYEAYRALRGAQLRSEVYVHDESNKKTHPYTVSESSYQVKTLQDKGENKHAVFFTTSNESLNYHYERNPEDPRISQTITLAVDDHGNVTDKVSIGYPRRKVPEAIPEQGVTHIVYSHIDFINQHQPHQNTEAGFYYAGVPFQTRDYEITGLHPQDDAGHYTADDFLNALVKPPVGDPLELLDKQFGVDTNTFDQYQWQPDEGSSGTHRRIIEWTRNYFRMDGSPELIDSLGNLEHRLSLGTIGRLALPYESYQAAFDQSLLNETFGNRLDEGNVELAEKGGYHPHPAHPEAEFVVGYWWIPSGRQSFNPDKFYQSERAQDAFGHISSTSSDVYGLLPEIAQDALPEPQTNVVTAKNDYRVLQPYEVTDPNRNISQVAFDALGFVVGTAIQSIDKEGKLLGDSLENFVADLPDTLQEQHFADPMNLDQANDTNPHSILKGASTRLVYDLHRYSKSGEPNAVYTLTRETHVSDEQEQGVISKIQHAFTYSDGFGREWQSKVQAEPEKPVEEEEDSKPRWVSTGSTIFNNKGKPVQQFEPFFSDDHLPSISSIEEHGVSPTLFYDPLGRVICTFHPNHSYEKVVFDPWQQASWDGNDTVLLNPREDEDVSAYTNGFFAEYDADYLAERGEAPQSWFEINNTGTATQPATAEQKAAASQTQKHANTPGIVHLDALGRPVLTIEDNGTDATGQRQLFRSRVVLDIEGNQREVIDAREVADSRGLPVMRYGYDMTRTGDEEDESGTLIYQNSMDGGERWLLHNVVGNPIRSWDSRGHVLRTTYDELQRPKGLWLSTNGADETLVEQVTYGEAQDNAQALNLKGQVFRQRDGAGQITFREYDFKGNPVETSRRLLAVSDTSAPENSDSPVDWSQDPKPVMDAEEFVSSSLFDALNRPVEVITPHTDQIKPNTIYPVYNDTNLLERMEVKVRGAAEATVFVSNIDYNEKGLRKQVTCIGENGKTVFTTTYTYETETFRLSQLVTKRESDQKNLQDLSYTYDPVGNITSIRDSAHQDVYFKNIKVEPHCSYIYDPLYRLVKAVGREHAQHSIQLDAKDAKPEIGMPFTNSPEALQRYTEEYLYDAVGNILSMKHNGGESGWKRFYQYAQDSNRLLATSRNSQEFTASGSEHYVSEANLSQKYEYDAHGSMVKMPHLPVIGWDFKDQLLLSGKQINNRGNAERTHYRYDASGERVRKFTIGANGKLKNERLYLGGLEIYREYGGDQVKLARETLHVMDDQQRVALVETKTVDAEQPNLAVESMIRFQLGNHLGSASLELSGSGEVITYEEYHPFGTSAYRSGKSEAEVSLKRYRYTGMERDEETGLAYHSARYYLPWLGRWGSVDPIGIGDGNNLYQQVHANPIRLIDPNGTSSWDFSDLNDLAKEVGEALRPVLNDMRTPIQADAQPMSKREAKKHGKKQAKGYRKSAGMNQGAEVQAAHTAAVRHAPESGISKKDWDKQQMQQLHSRKGKGLNVTVTDKANNQKVTTRHRAQEGLIDEAIDRSKAANGGKLTPQGQLDAANEVMWRTENVPMDQRDIDTLRSSGSTKRVKSGGKKIAPNKSRFSKFNKALAKAGKRLAAAVPFLGVAAGGASAAHAASQGDYTGAALDGAGVVPVVGDVVDGVRGVVALGEVAVEGAKIVGSEVHERLTSDEYTLNPLDSQIAADTKSFFKSLF